MFTILPWILNSIGCMLWNGGFQSRSPALQTNINHYLLCFTTFSSSMSHVDGKGRRPSGETLGRDVHSKHCLNLLTFMRDEDDREISQAGQNIKPRRSSWKFPLSSLDMLPQCRSHVVVSSGLG